MDIKCPRCGEPWDTECLHEETSFRHPDKPWYSETPEQDWHKPNAEGLYHNQKEYEKFYNVVRQEFYKDGCIALTAYDAGTCQPNPSASIYGALYEFAGDDIDFAASMIEDAERFGL